jgi:hypothetical protein
VPRTSRGRELRAVLVEVLEGTLGDWEVVRDGAAADFRSEDGGLGDNVPCVCDDDVVEWGVLLAEARETYP